MPRPKRTVLEYRRYELPKDFPILLLTGEQWHISPVPSGNLHIHNCMEIGLCHSQSGTMVFNRTHVGFEAGCVSCVARNVPHTTWSSPGEASLWSYLFLDPQALLGPALFQQYADALQARAFVSDCHLMLSPQEHPWAAALVRDIIDEMLNQPPAYATCVRSLCVCLITRLMRIYCETDALSEPDSAVHALLPALNHINEHYMQDFPQNTLAELCALSPTHFRRLFREQIGMPPLAFLHQTRVEKSCALLYATNLSIAEIAGRVGYPSLSGYNRHFLQTMGCSPSAWRRTRSESNRAVFAYQGWTEAEQPIPLEDSVPPADDPAPPEDSGMPAHHPTPPLPEDTAHGA